jgi:hypothetical protein
MKARRENREVTTGLKSISAHRKFAAKGYIPRDLDGAYRVAGRLDLMDLSEVYAQAEKRKAG